VARNARYDEIADWYPTWVGDGDGLIAEGVGDLLPPTVLGTRVLDVAWGNGRAFGTPGEVLAEIERVRVAG
jgi:hypothetical protein